MRKLFQTYPNISRLIAGALLIGLALIASGFIKIPIPYFPFGVTCVVVATWLMYRTEHKNLSELGLTLTKRNLLFLPLGLLLGIVAFVFGFQLTTYITGQRWNLNHNIQYSAILGQLYWVLPAAAVQEFIARGYCFKKLIEMSNPKTGIIVFGLLSIAMHDFWNGNVFNILIYAATLFIGHLWLSEALLKSGTMYFSIGLHWGNNFANGTLFTDGQREGSIFFTTNPPVGHPFSWSSVILVFLAANMGFTIMTYITWKWKSKRSLVTTDQDNPK